MKDLAYWQQRVNRLETVKKEYERGGIRYDYSKQTKNIKNISHMTGKIEEARMHLVDAELDSTVVREIPWKER